MGRLRAAVHGLASLVALAVLLAGVPWALVRWGRLPDTSGGGWWSQLTDSAVSDTTVFAVLTVAAWVAWAIFAASVAVEAVAGVRGVRAPQLSLAGPLQRLARSLVVPVLLLVSLAQSHPVAASPRTTPFPTPTAASTTIVVETPDSPAPSPTDSDADRHPSSNQDDSPPAATPTAVLVVERNDNPWKLAEEHLGDGMRWRDLWELNRGIHQPDGRAWTVPDEIHEGWHLRLPADARQDAPADTGVLVHVVEDGDTLSGLAARYLGDPDRYPELFAANRDVVQPDGRQLTDPDLIVIGWHLTIRTVEPTTPASPPDPATPSADPPPAEAESADTTPEPTPAETEVAETPPPAPPSTATTAPAPPSTEVPAATTPPNTATPDTAVPVASPGESTSAVPVVAGIAGAVALATGIALRLRWLRRRRATRDPAQRTAATTPVEIEVYTAADEPLVRWGGQSLAAMVQALDRRRVTAAPVAVEISEEAGIEVLWDAPQDAAPPTGWAIADGGWAWRLAYDPDAAVPADELPAAIPALVTIGQRDGRQLLVDLESFGLLTVDGPAEHARAFASALAVELACGNDLSDAYVTTVGFDIDPAVAHGHRLAATDQAGAAAVLENAARSIADVLAHDGSDDTFRARTGTPPPIESTVVVACDVDASDLDELSTQVQARRGVALVACADHHASSGGARVKIDPSGRSARLEPLGIDFEPVGLPTDTIAAIETAAAALGALPEPPPDVRSTGSVPSNGHRPPSTNEDATTADDPPSSATPPVTDAGLAAEQQPGTVTPSGAAAAGFEDGRLFVLPTEPAGGPPEMVVRVLGVPRIDERPDIARRQLILAALLACRGGTLAASAAQDALWGGKPVEAKTVWNFVAKVRRALGDFADGTSVMPAADRTRGTLRLDPRVTTDLALLRQAIDRADSASSVEAVRLLRDGLGLVEGPPFDGAGYDWAHRDQDVAEAAGLIEQAVDRLVALAVDAGQVDVAREGVIRGLRGLPGTESLYRTRMRIEATAGNHAGIAAAYDELTVYLADLETEPSPATNACFHELMGQHRAGAGTLR